MPSMSDHASPTYRTFAAAYTSHCRHCQQLTRPGDEIVVEVGGSRIGWHRACGDEIGLQYEAPARKKQEEPAATRGFFSRVLGVPEPEWDDGEDE